MTQCVYIWLVAAMAVAQPKVVVLPLSRSADVPADVVSKLDGAVFTELAERRQLTAVRADKLKGTDALATPQSTDAIALADKALREGALETAVRSLEKYIATLERAQAQSAVHELADAYLLLSTAQFQRANDDEGQKALDAFVRLRPDRELQGDYPPLFVRLHKSTRDRQRSKAHGEIKIDVDATNAEVSLNGRALGVAPVVIQNVPAGTHYLSVKLDGRQAVRRVESNGSDAKTHRFFLGVGSRKVLASNRLDAREKSALAEVARAENADAVVAGVVMAGNNEWTLYTVIVNSRGEGNLLGQYSVDRDLLSANVEAGKLAERALDMLRRGIKDDIVNQIVPGMVPESVVVVDAFTPGMAERVAGTAIPVVIGTPPPPPQPAEALVATPIRPYAEPLIAERDQNQATVSKPIYKRWWFWTIVGVAVVGGAATATALVVTAKVDRVSVGASW